MEIKIEQFNEKDLDIITKIWNDIVFEGKYFPQDEPLNITDAREFFALQSHVGVAKLGDEILGLYILHPNNVGRCSHIANASYGVLPKNRGEGIGALLVKNSLEVAKNLDFKILQFNAVVTSNAGAIHLYKKLGFTPLGVIPKGFRLNDNTYEDIMPFYIEI
ncbi:MAG: GNAT family N-acetyltransferase [Lachnospirales bacterium]